MSGPNKDIQTWFRLVSKNMYVRRRQLDSKSATVFSFSATMASLGFSTYPYVRHDAGMTALVALFVMVCFISMYLGVHAMHPKIRGPGRPTDEQLRDGVPMLTTFEHFRNMSEEEYHAAVLSVIHDEARLRRSLAMDLHHLGVELGERFGYLRLSYGIFATALFILVFTFLYIQWKMFT